MCLEVHEEPSNKAGSERTTERIDRIHNANPPILSQRTLLLCHSPYLSVFHEIWISKTSLTTMKLTRRPCEYLFLLYVFSLCHHIKDFHYLSLLRPHHLLSIFCKITCFKLFSSPTRRLLRPS